MSPSALVCEGCGERNRARPQAVRGPRCRRCHRCLPWLVDASDDDFARVVGSAPLPGRVFSWASSSPGVAVVSSLGVVRGVAPGSATITGTSEGKSATATVTVVIAPVVRSAISSSAMITGDYSRADAERIANGIGMR